MTIIYPSQVNNTAQETSGTSSPFAAQLLPWNVYIWPGLGLGFGRPAHVRTGSNVSVLPEPRREFEKILKSVFESLCIESVCQSSLTAMKRRSWAQAEGGTPMVAVSETLRVMVVEERRGRTHIFSDIIAAEADYHASALCTIRSGFAHSTLP
uniref:Uncharacterized protein n=1 Tax=Ditylenchus dipsaci TaxID=166011 RepID=A0A915CWA0_9BILA